MSDVFAYRQCVLDAAHTGPCLMAPDWLEGTERVLQSLRDAVEDLTHEYDRNAPDDPTCGLCGRSQLSPFHRTLRVIDSGMEWQRVEWR